jgi:hypothetical protein
MPIRPISTGPTVTQFDDPVSPISEGMLNATATLGALGPKLAEIRMEREQRQENTNRWAADEGVDPGHGGIWSVVAMKRAAQQKQQAGDHQMMMQLEQKKADAAIAAHKAAQSRQERLQQEDDMRWLTGGAPHAATHPTAPHLMPGGETIYRDEKGNIHRLDAHGDELAPGETIQDGVRTKAPPPAPVQPTSGYTGDPAPGWQHLWGAFPGMHGVPSDADFNASQDAALAAGPVHAQAPAGMISPITPQAVQPAPASASGLPGAAARPAMDPIIQRVSQLHPDDQSKYQAILKSGNQQLIDQANQRLMQAPPSGQ